MKYADLHIHSNYSDGAKTPEEIIEIAKQNNVKCISITDHDCIKAQYVTKNTYNDIEVIPGIELSTEYKDLELHILGYFIDIENSTLKDVVNKLNKSRSDRIEEILLQLKKNNIHLSLEELAVDINSTLGRSHVANAMVKKGYFDNYKTAFTSFLVKGKPAYVKGFKLDYKKTIDVINKAGGIAVLAHPGQIYRGMDVEKIIKDLKCYGLKGIEVYHPSHSKCQINNFYNLSKKYKICITGGSDYHGKELIHDTRIGSYGINELLLNKIYNLKSR
ncbi:PHP domain-containing protein [Clostridium septicum]|uniref:PHP domain-containing protein n=1 Tax=Clostridium septicum TaxID=1504 RepID=A0A9N7PKF8_CLOSE|nr:PHP domain-containing protein [Clostridium septicum]AYE33466.1 PHP domain-containing protein [Clostridium septicum]MDU1314785.1 PHP domain-containing protein [Clostridium septicum]QAS61637.1 PHP domain-containing protein [Clostridium septicum]UEC21925.1 PHP domain-containing protein [Clostridium septicum]USS00044.1 PHP domain-containing protein [Clostridium septicum]